MNSPFLLYHFSSVGSTTWEVYDIGVVGVPYKEEIKRLFRQIGCHPTPAIGQHFLISRKIQRKEVKLADLSKRDEVLDIGAGFGFLTKELAKKARIVYAIEKDKKIAQLLEKRLASFIDEGRIEITVSDVMELALPKVSKIVSNPPYHIISPLLIKILRELFTYSGFQFGVMILQKTYAERLLSEPGEENWGRLPAALKYFGGGKKSIKVPRNAFYPPPEVPSTLVKIAPDTTRPEAPISFSIYEKTTGLLFSYLNKKVRNAVKFAIKKQNKDWRPIVNKVEEKVGRWKRVREIDKEDIFKIAELFLEENIIDQEE